MAADAAPSAYLVIIDHDPVVSPDGHDGFDLFQGDVLLFAGLHCAVDLPEEVGKGEGALRIVHQQIPAVAREIPVPVEGALGEGCQRLPRAALEGLVVEAIEEDGEGEGEGGQPDVGIAAEDGAGAQAAARDQVPGLPLGFHAGRGGEGGGEEKVTRFIRRRRRRRRCREPPGPWC